jgi:predicted chitinase
MISSRQFNAIFPNCPAQKAKLYLPFLILALQEFQITTRKRAAAFFAQLGHESLDFKYMQELASGAAYEGRKDLGNMQPGDGRKYKGHGPIQITGRANHTAAGRALNLDLVNHPTLITLPEHAFRSAGWFWNSRKLNVYADALTARADAKDLGRFDKITKIINGGYNGKVDRQRRYLIALSVLTDQQFQDARLEETLSALTVPTPAPAPQPVEHTVQATTPAQPAQTATPVESSLLDELPLTEQTKAVGGSIARRLGVRVGGIIFTLWASGLVGRIFLILAAVAIVVVIYRERKAVTDGIRKLVKKLKGAQ